MNYLLTPAMDPPLPAQQHKELARFINQLRDDPHLDIRQRSLLRRLIDAVEENHLRNYWINAQLLVELLCRLWNVPADGMRGSGINHVLDSAFLNHPVVVVGQYDVERQVEHGSVGYLFSLNGERLAAMKAEAERLTGEAGLKANFLTTALPDKQPDKQPDPLHL